MVNVVLESEVGYGSYQQREGSQISIRVVNGFFRNVSEQKNKLGLELVDYTRNGSTKL